MENELVLNKPDEKKKSSANLLSVIPLEAEVIRQPKEDLFGVVTISTISYDQNEIIENILHLHSLNQKIDLDPTYSVGNFYKNGLAQPEYKFDLVPQVEGVLQSDARHLPLGDSEVETIMFDPPFVIGGELHDGIKEGSSIIAKRFSNFTSWEELQDLYYNSLKEFYRILKPKGIVIFKCQDCVACSKQHFSHVEVMNYAVQLGFYPKDLFILLAKNRLTDGRIQQHARKFHSYFWVFEKSKCKIDYGLSV